MDGFRGRSFRALFVSVVGCRLKDIDVRPNLGWIKALRVCVIFQEPGHPFRAHLRQDQLFWALPFSIPKKSPPDWEDLWSPLSANWVRAHSGTFSEAGLEPTQVSDQTSRLCQVLAKIFSPLKPTRMGENSGTVLFENGACKTTLKPRTVKCTISVSKMALQ